MNVSRLLLADMIERIARDLATKPFDTLNTALRLWLLDSRVEQQESLKCREEALAGATHKRSYRDVAALAYLSSRNSLNDGELMVLRSGMAWLATRPPKSPTDEYQSFVSDPVALLGLASASPGEHEVKEETLLWLRSFVGDMLQQSKLVGWKRELYKACAQICQIQIVAGPTDESPDVTVALMASGSIPKPATSFGEDLSLKALEEVKRVAMTGAQDPAHSILALATYDALMMDAPVLALGQPTVEQIVELLGRVDHGLRRWTYESKPRTSGSRQAQWHIDNEYHVQNLLYAILSPLLPGLREEENLPSVGHKNPRVDLAYPPLQLLIEVKFMRASSTFSDMTEEIAADASLYLKPGSPYQQIVAFIWDDVGRTQEYPLFVHGLRELVGIVDAVVVSRPTQMGASWSTVK